MLDKEKAEIFSKSLDEFLQGTENRYRWHDLRLNPEDLPEPEHEVEVRCQRWDKIIATQGFYENGKIHSKNSECFWVEIDEFAEYCEETDDYIIPEGWWEVRHYNPDDVYNSCIDDCVIAWREIEPFEEGEE